MASLKNEWLKRDTRKKGLTFYEWFLKFKTVKEAMLAPIRIDAGLGDPPTEYTTNDIEAGNLMVKYHLNFTKSDPAKFINDIKDVIDLQFRNEDRAVCGGGPYKLAKGFGHLGVDGEKWGKMSEKQRETLLK